MLAGCHISPVSGGHYLLRLSTRSEGHGPAQPRAVDRIPLMRLTVLGGCGAWPESGQACSGFLVEHDGFRLLIDLGYATLPRLLEYLAADRVDAVFISHGHRS